MNRKLNRLILLTLLGVLLLSAFALAARPWRLDCRDYVHGHPPPLGEVGFCRYDNPTKMISVGSLPENVCDDPYQLKYIVCARYNLQPRAEWGGVYQQASDEEPFGATCIRNELIVMFRCEDWDPMAVLCPRVFAEE